MAGANRRLFAGGWKGVGTGAKVSAGRISTGDMIRCGDEGSTRKDETVREHADVGENRICERAENGKSSGQRVPVWKARCSARDSWRIQLSLRSAATVYEGEGHQLTSSVSLTSLTCLLAFFSTFSAWGDVAAMSIGIGGTGERVFATRSKRPAWFFAMTSW